MENHIGGVPMKKYKGHTGATYAEPSKTVKAGVNGVPGGENMLVPWGKEGPAARIRPLLDALPKLPPSGFTAVELFAGGGLMRLGTEHAGITTIWANDFDKGACTAYGHNFGKGSIVYSDITRTPIGGIPDSDFIIGGPPCQDYSVAGDGAGEEGERGKLVWTYLDIINQKGPKAFLFENVKGLILKKHRDTFDRLLDEFRKVGYNVSWKLINAWDYGVAQKRERVFIVGIREDFEFNFEFPKSEFELTGYHPVLRDAIGDLPEPSANHDPKPLSEKALDYLHRDPRHLQKHKPGTMDEPSSTLPAVLHKGVPYGLVYPNHSEKDCWTPPEGSEYTYGQANRVQDMGKPSNTIPAHHNSGQPIHPQYANHQNIKNERTSRDESSMYNGAKLSYAVQPMDDACNTVTEKARGGDYLCHPQPRRFTVRECLRIQSVPDSYTFPESMKLSPMYKVVGNGVASRVAYHLGKSLVEQFNAYSAYQEAAATKN